MRRRIDLDVDGAPQGNPHRGAAGRGSIVHRNIANVGGPLVGAGAVRRY
jgi:hypothetical protein